MFLGYVHGAAYQEHYHYLGKSCLFPMCPSKTQTREDQWFVDLLKDIPKPPTHEYQ